MHDLLKRLRLTYSGLSIGLRFTLMVLLVVLAAALSGYSSIVFWQLSSQRDRNVDFAESITQLVAQDFVRIFKLNDISAAADLSAKLSAFPPLRRAALFGSDGVPLYRYSRQDLPRLEPPPLPEQLPFVSQGESAQTLHVFREASYAGMALGVVMVEMEVDDLMGVLKRDVNVLSGITLMVVILSVLLAQRFARQFNRPVLRLADFLDDVGLEGRLDQRIHTNERNEIGKLYGEVNDMLARLEASSEATRIATAAFEAPDGMMITDADNVILRVNQGFTHITGYTAADVVGNTPRLLSSGRHDSHFFDAMWQSLLADDRWEGEVWNRHRDGTVFPCRLTIQAVRDSQGDVRNYVGALFDISRQKNAEAELAFLDRFDPLTGLANRRQLLDKILEVTLPSCEQSSGQAALMCFDVNDFKRINDTFGHAMGDMLLVEIGRRLRRAFNGSGFVARLAADEFAVVLKGLPADAEAAALDLEARAESVLLSLGRAYALGDETVRCTPSAGIAMFGSNSSDVQPAPESIVQQAEAALHHAKSGSDKNWCFFDPDSQQAARRYQTVLGELEVALVDQQIVPYYQIQVDDKGAMIGVELLARWIQADGSERSPNLFIPVAERSGLIHILGRQMLRSACLQLVAWREHPVGAGLSISVNVTAQQFLRHDFIDTVRNVLQETVASPHKLKLELTESAMIEDIDLVVDKMQMLTALGIRISLDDFGTGYSCLRYLKRLPLSQVKIDQSFVRDMGNSPNDTAIVRSILSLGATMGFEVIAEGVETQAHYEALQALGCRFYQGYWFGRPVPAEALDFSV